MKFLSTGMTCKQNHSLNLDGLCFSREEKDVMKRLQGKNRSLILIKHCKKTAPLEWVVHIGRSQIYFRSFAEAMAFCRG